jgi:hypothetical protein
MIISRGRRYIFVHIPKTGGTSLALALEARAMKDDILIGDTPKARARRRRLDGLAARGRLWKHSTLADIEGLLSPDEMAGMMIVTLVRNPWDRVVSYYHWLRGQDFDHPAVRLARRHDFTGFLKDPGLQASLRGSPYGSYVRDPAGVERPALFARLEESVSELAAFESHLGFRITPLPRDNVSERAADYRRHFNDETRQIVADAAAEDISRFGYSF